MTPKSEGAGIVTARLRTASDRLRRALQRRNLDGRFPEPVVGLLTERWRLELKAAAQRVTAALLPPHGGVRAWGAPTVAAGGEWRRWVSTAAIEQPRSEQAHRFAASLLPRLEEAGLRPFLVDADGGRLHFGLAVADRDAALRALAGLDPAEAWYVRWRRGGRRRVGLLNRRSSRRHARRAESWVVFRCLAIGPDEVAGIEEGVEISFWTPAGDRMERLGYRGLNRFELSTGTTTETVAGRDYPGLAAFPVGRSLLRFREPVDVVYTWVDSADPAWRADFDRWRDAAGAPRRAADAVDPFRFVSFDELRYSLRSLWLNAGWVRHVYVVTADQVPDWLVPDDRLTVVSHRDIFPADWLPTFNSHAIEARLHHIEGLAEHFVYFNDDMLLGRPVTPEAFFTANGLSRFFESEARIPVPADEGGALAADAGARTGRRLIESEFGSVVGRKLHHAPYPLRRSVLFEIEERFPEVMEATARHRFRSADDLSVASAFAHHYAFSTGRAVPGELHIGYQNLGSRRLDTFLRRVALGRDLDVVCVNATERWETDPAAAAARLGAFLGGYYPVASPWEVEDPETATTR